MNDPTATSSPPAAAGDPLAAAVDRAGAWWTVAELARRWKLSKSTVQRLLETGKLHGKRFGHQWRVCDAAIAAYERDGIPSPRPKTAELGPEWQGLPEYV